MVLEAIKFDLNAAYVQYPYGCLVHVITVLLL